MAMRFRTQQANSKHSRKILRRLFTVAARQASAVVQARFVEQNLEHRLLALISLFKVGSSSALASIVGGDRFQRNRFSIMVQGWLANMASFP